MFTLNEKDFIKIATQASDTINKQIREKAENGPNYNIEKQLSFEMSMAFRDILVFNEILKLIKARKSSHKKGE